MRPVLLALAVLAVVCGRAAAADTLPCGPAEAETLAAGSLTRVYVDARRDRYRACTRGVRRAASFAFVGCRLPAGCDGSEQFRIAGRLVVYGRESADGTFLDLLTIDAATDRQASPQDYALGNEPRETRRIAALVAAPDGATAVAIAHTPLDPSRRPAGVEIRRSAGCGVQRLDDGPGVDAATLRLTGDGWITWTSGGLVRRARACPSVRVARRACAAARRHDVLATSRSTVLLDAGTDDLRFAACAGRHRVLGPYLDEFEELVEAAAGRGWVAYWTRYCGKDDCLEFLQTLDVRTGRDGLVTGGEPIDPGSLRIAGGRVRWTSGGTPHSRRLPRRRR